MLGSTSRYLDTRLWEGLLHKYFPIAVVVLAACGKCRRGTLRARSHIRGKARMQPTKLTVFNLFERPRRYVVPLYQRQYVWDEEEQWEPLWNDIKVKADGLNESAPSDGLAKPPTNHFLGAVV